MLHHGCMRSAGQFSLSHAILFELALLATSPECCGTRPLGCLQLDLDLASHGHVCRLQDVRKQSRQTQETGLQEQGLLNQNTQKLSLQMQKPRLRLLFHKVASTLTLPVDILMTQGQPLLLPMNLVSNPLPFKSMTTCPRRYTRMALAQST